jgi:hypothetical protein
MMSCPSILNTSPSELAIFWQEQIELQRTSGLSRSAYCRKHNLVVCRFSYWERKLTKSTTKLLPVTLNPIEARADTICTLVLRNGNQLKIHDLAILQSLLSILA